MLLAAALITTACGGSAAAPPSDESAPPTASSEQSPASSVESSEGDTTGTVPEGTRRGDELVIAVELPATTLDPARINAAFSTYTSVAYESLLDMAPDGEVIGALAETWEFSDGNRAFTLTLRPDLAFADGTPLDATAVVDSLEYTKGAGGTGQLYFADISAITAVDDLTVRIDSNNPNPALDVLLTPKSALGQIISPAGIADPDRLSPEYPSQGAGAYIFNPDASVPGDRYVYDRNEGYYNPEKQHYERMIYQVINDPQAALNALITGQVDIIVGSPETLGQAENNGLQIVYTPFVWQGLSLIDRDGETNAALGDVRVRQAINYALDRETIAAAVLGEYGVATATVQVPGGEGWTEAIAATYPYDPDAARALLAEAGYADGLKVEVLSIAFAGIDTMAEAIKGQLAEVGIELNITTVADEASYVVGATDRSYGALAVGYGAQPMFIMGPGLFLPNASVFNGYASESSELSQLYADAAAASGADRDALNESMLAYLTDEAWFAPVAFAPVFYFARADLGGLGVSPNAPTADPLFVFESE